jgi:asparagine synthetase B (glutamine-hydrolysing)
VDVPDAASDTPAMLALLGAAVANAAVDAAAAAVMRALVTVRGPYAVIFYAAASRRLYYARDTLARRSLLRHVSPQGGLVLSSVAPAEGLPPLPRANSSNSSTAALQLDGASDSNDSGDDHGDTLVTDAIEQQQQQQQQLSAVRADCAESQQQRDSPAAVHAPCAWQELPATGVYWIDLSGTTAAGSDGAFVHGHEPWQGAVTLHPKQHTSSSSRSSRSSSDSSSNSAVCQSSVQSLINGSDAPLDSNNEPVTEPATEPIAEQEVPAGFFTDEHRAEASALLLAALRQSVYRRISTILVRAATAADGSSTVTGCSSSSSYSPCAATADNTVSTVSSTTAAAAGADVSSAALDLANSNSTTATTATAGENDAPVDKLQLQLQPARVGVLFSGGLDSVVLAALVAECNGMLTSSNASCSNGSCSNGSGESAVAAIDLINVCFDAAGGHSSPDRKAAVR